MKETKVNCPRCLGKGFVDINDIDRLDMNLFWSPGKCKYCDGIGKVEEKIIEENGVTSLYLDKFQDSKDNFDQFEIQEGITFNSFKDFINKVSKGCSHYIFRGQSNYDYKLTSTINRKFIQLSNEKNKNKKILKFKKPMTKRKIEEFLLQEKSLLSFFKARAKSTVNTDNYNDWEWLALAQHYGISTRIIDWTENPLIALYFASIENKNKDGAIFLHHTTKLIDIDKNNPFDSNLNGFIIAPYITNRLASQSAVFSISSDPWNEFISKENDVIKCRLTKKFKKEMRKLLPVLGINKRTVFVDLDSVAKDIDDDYVKKVCKSNNQGITFH